MIYCFRAFHTEKNVISVSHEKNGNFLFFQLINGAKVKKSLHITSHFRRKFLRLSFFPFSFPLMRFNICTSFFAEFSFSLFSAGGKRNVSNAIPTMLQRAGKEANGERLSTLVTFTLDGAYTWANNGRRNKMYTKPQ